MESNDSPGKPEGKFKEVFMIRLYNTSVASVWLTGLKAPTN